MDELPEELRKVFQEEGSELLDQIAQLLEGVVSAKAERREQNLHEIRRLVHNLKGSAGTVGFQTIATVAHAFEDAIDAEKTTGRSLPKKFVEALVDSIALMERLLQGEALEAETRGTLGELQSLAAAAPRAEDPPATRSTKAPRKRAAGAASPGRSTRAIRESEAEPAETEPAADPTAGATAESGATTLRVESDRLDRLMAYTRELLVMRARLESRVEGLEHFQSAFAPLLKSVSAEERSEIRELSRGLDALIQADRKHALDFGYLTDEIGSAMKRVRMLPLSSVAPAWRQIIREAARELGKRPQLEIEVGEIELDKHVLDTMRDAFLHLLRNAVDHGLEDPDERIAAGKPAEGRIRIEATMQGAMVLLRISDDGRGLSPATIREVAMRRGLIESEQAATLSDDQTLDLLFHPGFTTTRKVSQMSGRGVGLDVVRRRAQELGGNVRASRSRAFGGAQFELSLPVSLLSIRGLLVRAGEAVCAVPIDHVVRTIRVGANQIQKVDGSPTVVIEDEEPLRVRYLTSIMGQPDRQSSDFLTVAVVTRKGARLGIVVNEVLSEYEFVTGPLPWNLKSVAGVSGTFVLGDGTLAVVVDIAQIFDSTMGVSEPTAAPDPADLIPRKPCVMVVDDSLTSRTLERNILRSAGYEVIVAVDGDEAWEALQHHPVQLVVTDVQMPRMNGLELTRRIRDSAKHKHLPVVLVTSLGRQEDLAAGSEAGADEYIVKGEFEQRILLEAVARLI